MIAGTDKTISHEATTQTATTQTAPAAAIRSFFLEGRVGRLEALLNEGSPNAPFAVVLAHPHPKGGGTMHNKVVYHAMKVFSGLGWPVLRFNFRGTGLSEGAHSGRDEFEDVRTALDWMSAEFGKPGKSRKAIIGAGFSFGAAMGLKAARGFTGSDGDGLAGFAALGLPTHAEGRDYSYPHMIECRFPKLFLSGDRDQYAPAAQLTEIANAAPEPKRFVLVPGADHFFTGHLAEMQTALGQWLGDTYMSESHINTPQATPHTTPRIDSESIFDKSVLIP